MKNLIATIALLTVTTLSFAASDISDMLNNLNSGEYTQTIAFEDLSGIGTVTHYEHKETYEEFVVVSNARGTKVYNAGQWHINQMSKAGKFANEFFYQRVASKEMKF